MNIYDVAKEAGVSIATVSRVLNGKENVSATTAKRVKAVLKQFDYTPNNLARALATNSMDIIGVVMEDIRNRQYTSTAYHIERELYNYGYSAMFCNVPSIDIHSNAQTFAQTRISGLIIIGSVFMRDTTEEAIQTYLPDIPIVVANGSISCNNGYSLLVDDGGGIMQAVTYLFKAGHKRIAYVNDNNTDSARRKLQGYKNALHQCDDSLTEVIIQTESSYEGGRRAAIHLMEEYEVGKDFTAVVFPEDITAIGSMHAFQEHGIAVPRDVAIIGFGNSVFRPITHPLLTTIDTHLDTLGSESVRFLMRRINGETCPKQIQLIPDLLLGESA